MCCERGWEKGKSYQHFETSRDNNNSAIFKAYRQATFVSRQRIVDKDNVSVFFFFLISLGHRATTNNLLKLGVPFGNIFLYTKRENI